MATKEVTKSTPTIFKASLSSGGDVIKGAALREVDAVAARTSGHDVVICGDNLSDNRTLAQRIEQAANGNYKRCPPHANAGANALPHFQPDPRPPDGHAFYETPNRKAK